MKIAGIVGIVVVLCITILLIYLSGYGLFSSVKITEKNVGPYLLIYEKHIGDYKNAGSVMDKLYYDLKDNYKIETTKGFGLYYDNPQDVAKEELRSIIGCIVEEKTIEDLKDLNNKYGIQEYPISKSVVAEFPFKGKMSIILGIFKVYPKLGAYLEKHEYSPAPVMELYDQPSEKIEYISSVNLSKEVFESFLKTNEK